MNLDIKGLCGHFAEITQLILGKELLTGRQQRSIADQAVPAGVHAEVLHRQVRVGEAVPVPRPLPGQVLRIRRQQRQFVNNHRLLRVIVGKSPGFFAPKGADLQAQGQQCIGGGPPVVILSVLVIVGIRNDQIGKGVGVVFVSDIAPKGDGVAPIFTSVFQEIGDSQLSSAALPQSFGSSGQQPPVISRCQKFGHGFRGTVGEIAQKRAVTAVVHLGPIIRSLLRIIPVKEPVQPIERCTSAVAKAGGEQVEEVVRAAKPGLLSPAGVVKDVRRGRSPAEELVGVRFVVQILHIQVLLRVNVVDVLEGEVLSRQPGREDLPLDLG